MRFKHPLDSFHFPETDVQKAIIRGKIIKNKKQPLLVFRTKQQKYFPVALVYCTIHDLNGNRIGLSYFKLSKLIILFKEINQGSHKPDL